MVSQLREFLSNHKELETSNNAQITQIPSAGNGVDTLFSCHNVVIESPACIFYQSLTSFAMSFQRFGNGLLRICLATMRAKILPMTCTLKKLLMKLNLENLQIASKRCRWSKRITRSLCALKRVPLNRPATARKLHVIIFRGTGNTL